MKDENIIIDTVLVNTGNINYAALNTAPQIDIIHNIGDHNSADCIWVSL
jgi:hypothetical protein